MHWVGRCVFERIHGSDRRPARHLLAAFGLAVGYRLATYTSRNVLAFYSNDLFRLPYVMSPQTTAFAVSGIVAVLLVAQWPALRRLAGASLAEAVSTHE
jgi:ABC-type antimicrobial peptide transport system permease subunit